MLEKIQIIKYIKAPILRIISAAQQFSKDMQYFSKENMWGFAKNMDNFRKNKRISVMICEK